MNEKRRLWIKREHSLTDLDFSETNNSFIHEKLQITIHVQVNEQILSKNTHLNKRKNTFCFVFVKTVSSILSIFTAHIGFGKRSESDSLLSFLRILPFKTCDDHDYYMFTALIKIIECG